MENLFLRFCFTIYNWIISFFSNFQSIFIFLMRLTWGYQFLIAGYGKLMHLDKITLFFEKLGIPLATTNATLVGGFEFFGGILLLVGFASRLISIPLIIIMLVAYSTAHNHIFSHFAFITNPTLLVNEAPFAFLLTCLIVLLFGPGKISIDGYLKRKFEEQNTSGE